MKYIVYLTTNTVNNKIYIGVHKTETPYKFDGYLGNGVKINDKYTYRNCKTPFETAVNKYGPSKFIRTTIQEFDTLKEALALEAELVDEKFIRRKDTYNITLGGGMPPVKVKIIYQYTVEGVFIKKWDSITEASLFYKCSSSTIGKAVLDRTPSLGYLWSENEIIDLEQFHLDENKVTTYLYDVNGEYLKTFKSITDTANYLRTTTPILTNVIKGKYCYNKQYYISEIKYDKFPILKPESHKGQPVYQYDMEGNFLKKWDTVADAQKEYGMSLNVHKAIRLGTSSKGFQWSWENVPYMKKLITKTRTRKVGKYDENGILIEVFNSVRSARQNTSGAQKALTSKTHYSGGYYWKYLED